VTRKQREDRARNLIPYFVRGGSMPAAKKIARAEGVTENTSVWLSALSMFLMESI